MSLCEYKDLFGKPGEGSHSYRIPVVNLAAVDVLATVVGAALISKYSKYSFFTILIMLVIFSIFIHVLFCVDTELIKKINYFLP